MGLRCEAAWWRGPFPWSRYRAISSAPRSGYLQRPEFVRSIAQMRAICPSETLIPVKASSLTRARKSLQGRHSTWRKS